MEIDEIDELEALLAQTRSIGIKLWVADGQLRFRAPTGAMTADLRGKLQLSKGQLLDALSGPRFYPRGTQHTVPILEFYHDYWRQIRSGEFDVGFTNGTSFIFECNFALDLPTLNSRIARLTARHSILRARVIDTHSGPEFVFDPENRALLRVVDLSTERVADQELLVRAKASELIWEPFDSAGPMFRIFVIKLAADRQLVGLVVHHFICDAVSLGIVSNELFGDLQNSSDLPLQYSDYVLATNEWVHRIGLQMRLRYWKRRLLDAPPTRLPPDFAYGADMQAPINVDPFHVSPDVVDALARLATSRHVTLFTILLAVKVSTLCALSGSEDIVVLIQHAGREDVRLLGVVGAITNRLAIRTSVSMQLRFAEFLTLIHENCLNAFASQVPYSLVQSVLQQIGASDIVPTVNFLDGGVALRADAQAVPKMRPFEISPPSSIGSPHRYSSHWMQARRDASGIHGNVGYSGLLYKRQTIGRFLRVFCNALKRATQDPDQALCFLVQD